MKLLPSQKNELFDKILQIGLDPAKFEFSTIPNTVGDVYDSNFDPEGIKLSYIQSEFNFIFLMLNRGEYCVYSPGKTRFTHSEYPGNWSGALNYFSQWLANLSREISSEDKWKRLEDEINKFNFKFNSEENDQFNVIEYEQVCVKIDLIKTNLPALALPEDQLNRIEESLEYLKGRAKVLGKFDWKNLFLGTIVQFTIQYSLPPEKVASFIAMIKHAFTQIFLR